MNFKQKQKLLNKLVEEHGLLKVAYAGCAPVEGIQQCCGPREIGSELLMLIEYRLKDPDVWVTEEWLKLLHEQEVHERKKIKLVKS